MAEGWGSAEGRDERGAGDAWPSQPSPPPLASAPAERPAGPDAPTEPEVVPTLESLASPPPPGFHDLSPSPAAGGAPFDAYGPGGAGYSDPSAYGGPGGYGGYGGPYGPYAYAGWAPPKNNGLAIAAMVCGICGFAVCQLCAIPALILGIRARRQIRESGGAEQGDAFALAGIILGGVGLALLVGLVVLYAVIIIAAASSGG